MKIKLCLFALALVMLAACSSKEDKPAKRPPVQKDNIEWSDDEFDAAEPTVQNKVQTEEDILSLQPKQLVGHLVIGTRTNSRGYPDSPTTYKTFAKDFPPNITGDYDRDAIMHIGRESFVVALLELNEEYPGISVASALTEEKCKNFLNKRYIKCANPETRNEDQ